MILVPQVVAICRDLHLAVVVAPLVAVGSVVTA